ncbi:hypothetical protein [Rhizobium leguminosarum]|uniref:hypothetical protein n=1 Tax=Rhizobium leguminosarum TaxID=384 RepID=UPI00048ED6EA|nr:hypothetical protein [Rhizobium leguminosarum]
MQVDQLGDLFAERANCRVQLCVCKGSKTLHIAACEQVAHFGDLTIGALSNVLEFAGNRLCLIGERQRSIASIL